MTGSALFFIIVGVCTVTGWLFRLVDAIEAPQGKRERPRANRRRRNA